jgi:putative oxidoreductase
MKGVLQRIVATQPGLAALIARVVVGLVILPHGLQKTLGWFGGYGFTGTMGYFTGTLHIPWIFAFAAILAESLGAVLLVIGMATRLVAGAIAVVMAVAVVMVHAEHGFFMNWFGNQKGEGFEYHLLAIGLCVVSVVWGGGSWSVDRRISRTS